MKILFFGNPLVKKDNLVLKKIPKLKKRFSGIEFKEKDSTENLEKEGRKLKIIDAVEGIEKVQVIKLENSKDFDKLNTEKIYSMHDFDLGYNLKLLKKVDLIDKVEIIALPMNIEEEEALNQIQLILRKWVAQDMQGS